MVTQAQARSDFGIRRSLAILGISPRSFYRWRRADRDEVSSRPKRSPGTLYAVLPSERRTILDYAIKYPTLRHRELAWKMVDDGVCCVSPSSVYRVLLEANLVCRWTPRGRVRGSGRADRPGHPDEVWQVDIRYTQVEGRNYYLLSFMDVYSRYIVYHELLRLMDGRSVSISAAEAVSTLPPGVRPTIQSDNGSCFVSREFAQTLSGLGIAHVKIRPHTPTDNAEIERCQRTIGEKLDEYDLEDYGFARQVVRDVIDQYNHVRLHSALSFLRPVDYYRGDPGTLLAERHRKLTTAREFRKQENLKLRQRRLPLTEEKTVA
jgi:transposase InsO family protein